MIKLTRLNGDDIWVNIDLIKFLESIPDTKITFINSDMLLVKEDILTVVKKIEKYKTTILALTGENNDA